MGSAPLHYRKASSCSDPMRVCTRHARPLPVQIIILTPIDLPITVERLNDIAGVDSELERIQALEANLWTCERGRRIPRRPAGGSLSARLLMGYGKFVPGAFALRYSRCIRGHTKVELWSTSIQTIYRHRRFCSSHHRSPDVRQSFAARSRGRALPSPTGHRRQIKGGNRSRRALCLPCALRQRSPPWRLQQSRWWRWSRASRRPATAGAVACSPL